MPTRAGLTLVVVATLAVRAGAEQPRFEIGLEWAGVLASSSSSYGGGVALKSTNAGALEANFRFGFRPRQALEFGVGHSSEGRTFVVNGNRFRVPSTTTEWHGAYVFRPFSRGKIDPFLLGGAGALRFSPGTTYINGIQSSFGAMGQTGLAFVYGGGADYRLWKGLGLRLEYRGLIYKQPDFGLAQFFTGARGHLAEPAAGIVFGF